MECFRERWAKVDESLVRRVEVDIVTAMKARDAGRVEALRMVKAALKNREIEKREPLTEEESRAVLGTLIKQRQDSVEQFTKGNRPELAAKEAGEITLIESYLPQQATEEELQPFVARVVGELGAGGMVLGPKAMGPAMKAVNEQIKGLGVRADGKIVSALVKAGLGEG